MSTIYPCALCEKPPHARTDHEYKPAAVDGTAETDAISQAILRRHWRRPGIDKAELRPWNWAVMVGEPDWAVFLKDKTDPVELLSYPIPQENKPDTIMIRLKPGDPTTLMEVPIAELGAISPEDHPWHKRDRVFYPDNPQAFFFRDELEQIARERRIASTVMSGKNRIVARLNAWDGPQPGLEATYAVHSCGCTIIGNGTLQNPLTINFCDAHSAAPAFSDDVIREAFSV